MSDSQSSKILQFIDYFIGDVFRENQDKFYKVRILVTVIITAASSVLAFALSFTLIPQMTWEAIAVFYYLGAPCLVMMAGSLYYLKRGMYYRECAQVTMLNYVLMIFLGVVVTGGPFSSSVITVLVAPAVLSFLLLGRRGGILWNTMLILAMSVLALMHVMGYEFADVTPPAVKSLMNITNWIFAIMLASALIYVYETLQVQLKSERDFQMERMEFLATHDSLTQLPNRVLFYDFAQSAKSRADRNDETFALIYFDLNGFKPINDSEGHEAGDHILKKVGERVTEALRKTDIVARCGGDEFVIIAENIESEDYARTVAAKVLDAINQPISYESKIHRVGASVGITFYPECGDDIDELIKQADTAMYSAKTGDNDIEIYDNDMMPEVQLT